MGTNRHFRPSHVRKAIVSFFLLCVAGVMLFPLYMIIMNSFKGLRQFLANPLALPAPFSTANYTFVIDKVDYFTLLTNNLIVEAASLFLIVLFSAMAGFTIARRPSKFKKALYTYVVLGITLPTFTVMIPQIRQINDIGLSNTRAGLVLLYVAAGMPMGIFLFNGCFGSAPKELEEAAKIDGCSYYRLFFNIFFPLSIATAATLVLVQSIGIWNDTTMPALLISATKKRTLMPELNTFYGRMVGQGTRWERIYAFAVLCMAPMIALFFCVNRYLVRGVVEGAIKG